MIELVEGWSNTTVSEKLISNLACLGRQVNTGMSPRREIRSNVCWCDIEFRISPYSILSADSTVGSYQRMGGRGGGGRTVWFQGFLSKKFCSCYGGPYRTWESPYVYFNEMSTFSRSRKVSTFYTSYIWTELMHGKYNQPTSSANFDFMWTTFSKLRHFICKFSCRNYDVEPKYRLFWLFYRNVSCTHVRKYVYDILFSKFRK